MYPGSRQIIHWGINFVVSPMPTISPHSNLGFQQSLVSQGIDFTKVELREREIIIVRDSPTRLEIKVAALGPPTVGQLLIVAPHPKRDFGLFVREAKAIVAAFSTWPEKSRHTVSIDATLRDLYETSREHAFQELWETRLHQPPEALSKLGRPVLGGGLRLVMPPQSDEQEPLQIEVKIESFLRDTKKIYVETQFTWRQPISPEAPLDPVNRLRKVNEYIEQNVIPFIKGDLNDHQ